MARCKLISRKGLLTTVTVALGSWFVTFSVWPGGVPASSNSSSSQQRTRLTGKVELLNARIKGRGGKVDASGVVIWLESRGQKFQGAKPRQRLNQQGKRFSPHIMVVEKGTEVDFPNSDPFYHNVFSLFDGKRFDLGLYASGESRPVLFNRVGISYIFCNIHPAMSAIIIAVDSPFFAVTNASGGFSIDDIPAGVYDLKVWHERTTPRELSAQTREIRVSGSGNLDAGIIRLNEAGYIPQSHLNKHGQTYDEERSSPRYKP